MRTDCHIMQSFFLSFFASWCHNISYGGNLQSNIPSICLCNCGIYQLDGALSAWDDLPIHCGRSNLIWPMHLSHKRTRCYIHTDLTAQQYEIEKDRACLMNQIQPCIDLSLNNTELCNTVCLFQVLIFLSLFSGISWSLLLSDFYGDPGRFKCNHLLISSRNKGKIYS